jgi:hypothetical protein
MNPATVNHRFSGLCVALASAVTLATIIIYFAVLGSPDPTGPNGAVTTQDSARYIQANQAFLTVYWLVEAAAISLLAVSGFTLRSRQKSTSIPTGWFWTAFGLGAAVNLIMYAYTLGVYPEAAASVGSNAALLQTARDASNFLFFLGNALMMLGLMGAFAGEALANDGVLPSWLAWIGAGVSFINFSGAAAGLLIGPLVMAFIGPVAVLGALLTVIFGWRIAVRG